MRQLLLGLPVTCILSVYREGYFFGAAGWFNTTTDPYLPPAQVFDVEDVRQVKRHVEPIFVRTIIAPYL